MNILCNDLTMQLEKNGNLASLLYKGRELLAAGAANRPLLTLRLLDSSGKQIDITSIQAKKTKCFKRNNDIQLLFQELDNLPLHIEVLISVNTQTSMTEWRANIQNDTDYIVEYIDFPEITVPNDLVSTGGNGTIFWPAMEGVLIEDVTLRDTLLGMEYKPVGYPSKGWEGIYPGPVPMQFMAYYHPEGGLYIASHDPHAITKAIEWHPVYENNEILGIRLEYRMFLAIESHSKYCMDFPMVLGALKGDWMQAAEIYRDWVTTGTPYLPLKLFNNSSMPDWFDESPLIVIYPVRGEKDTGQMEPNPLFPYSEALPKLDAIAKETGCRIMALLMHWEGTAPWAPPFIWPPYGGKEMFQQFVDTMHERGNLVGVYASGMGWTDESVLWPSYNMKQFRKENNLTSIMCAAPDQSLPNSMICNGPIRWGYDMCPACEKTQDIVVAEIEKVLASGVDYLQYFDQSLGGGPYLCYSKNHGHIPVPGKWQAEEMEKLYQKINSLIASRDDKPLIGCESAAAEPFIRHLAFNDLRYGIPSAYAKPVPAYAFVFHEYVVNFMGNHNTFSYRFPWADNPDSLLFRLAYSFIAGDMLTVVIRGDGSIIWDWGITWDTPVPDQKTTMKFIQNLSKMRKGPGKPFLHFGRMMAPHPIENTVSYTLQRWNNSTTTYPYVLTSRWLSPDRRQAQIFANFSQEAQVISIQANVCAIYTADGMPLNFEKDDNSIRFVIPPLSSICTELCDF